MKKILLAAGLAIILLVPVMSQNARESKVPEGIILSFKAGNAEELAKFFHSNVELIILEKEDVYSRPQAEQILRKFFSEHKPEGFKIIFEGGKENSRYAIGGLATADMNYRVYILMKKQDGSPIIHQLRIEEEDEDSK